MTNKSLVIVESPAKAKTINKYLGKSYAVMASYGHMRDLLPKSGSVETDNNFVMHYDLIDKNVKHVEAIAKALKKADSLILATDPDREGEAIAWHVSEIMRERGLLDEIDVKRVVFYEITKSSIQHAIDEPREINMDLVNAQQARRALDYLVGFNLSPLLWKKVRRGLSAGRVQSPALRLIVEREEEIEAFEAKEYWSIEASTLTDSKESVISKIFEYEGNKVEQFSFTDEKSAKAVKATLEKDSGGTFVVTKVEKKQRKRNPSAPFITSTLQQEAARKLGFTARRTMMIAQQLYEGIDIGSGSVGLITYMRTDSVNLAQEAVDEIREYITSTYGADQKPDAPRAFKTKSKNAQEAHEAIRPTSIKRTPKMVKDSLTSEQFKLYDLIWKRTLACQMIHATLNTVAVFLAAGEKHTFKANGSTIASAGFMAVYLEGTDDSKAEDDEKLLPEMQEGDKLSLEEIKIEQHFTEPPPRYSEASLVKALEEHGIGRPSTYASIIYTLQQREYVILDKKRFIPTDVGRIVNKFLTEYFAQYVDYDFTAKLEDSLDEVSRGEKPYLPLLEEFWDPFIGQIRKIDETVQRKDVTTEVIDEKCPKCNSQLTIRLGKRGRFIGCGAFPECDYTASLGEGNQVIEPEVIKDRKCPECKHELVIKMGRYGKFIGCSNYPNCKHIEPLEKPEDSGVACPVCFKGSILKRKTRKGKIFYSCSGYPECKYALWDEPLDEKCPKCSWPILSIKRTKTKGSYKLCPRDECKFKEPLEEE